MQLFLLLLMLLSIGCHHGALYARSLEQEESAFRLALVKLPNSNDSEMETLNTYLDTSVHKYLEMLRKKLPDSLMVKILPVDSLIKTSQDAQKFLASNEGIDAILWGYYNDIDLREDSSHSSRSFSIPQNHGPINITTIGPTYRARNYGFVFTVNLPEAFFTGEGYGGSWGNLIKKDLPEIIGKDAMLGIMLALASHTYNKEMYKSTKIILKNFDFSLLNSDKIIRSKYRVMRAMSYLYGEQSPGKEASKRVGESISILEDELRQCETADCKYILNYNLGLAYRQIGSLDMAADFLRIALSYISEIKRSEDFSKCNLLLFEIYIHQHDKEKARDSLCAAFNIAGSKLDIFSMKFIERDAIKSLGAIPACIRESLERKPSLCSEHAVPERQAQCMSKRANFLHKRAILLKRRDFHLETLQQITQLVELRKSQVAKKDARYSADLVHALHFRSIVEVELDLHEAAEKDMKEALGHVPSAKEVIRKSHISDIKQMICDQVIEGQIYESLGVLYKKAKRLTDALDHFLKAQSLFYDCGNNIGIQRVRQQAIDIYSSDPYLFDQRGVFYGSLLDK